MLKYLLALSVTCFGLLASADQVSTFCAPANQSVCIHLMFPNPISTAEEGQFIIHANSQSAGLVTELTADIWMDMPGQGHGSAPLNISILPEPNHYQVTNAWFVMTGPWIVRVSFKLNEQTFQIKAPLFVYQ